MTLRQRIRTRAGRVSIVVGLVVAVLALVGGSAYALTQHRSWTAETMLVVLPSTDLDATNAAAYYETLSRGQIVATYAEVAGEAQFQDRATAGLGLSTAEQQGLTTEVTVVPDTAVLLVRSTARDAATAERVSAATGDLAVQYLGTLTPGYRAVLVPTATGSATAQGFAPGVLLGAALVVALIAGLAVQQGVYHLMNAATAGRAVPAGSAPSAAETTGTTDPGAAVTPAAPAGPAGDTGTGFPTENGRRTDPRRSVAHTS